MQSISLLLKVLWSPGEAMYLLSKTPRVLVPMLFVSLFSIASAMTIQTKVSYGEMYMNMLALSPQARSMPQETKDRLSEVMKRPVTQAFFVVAAAVFPPLIILLVAAIYFGVFTMLGREGGFKAFLSITAYSFIPVIFSQLASVVRAFVVVPSSLMLDEIGSLSLAAYVDRDTASPILFAAANTVDLVTIWSLILLVIGYKFVTRKSVSTAARAGAVCGIFMVYVALKLAGAALGGR